MTTLAERTDQPNYVEFSNATSSNCRAHVGMKGGRQDILLSSRGCSVVARVHELGHAVGLFYEQQRAARDQHLMLIDQSLDERSRGAYAKFHLGTGHYNNASTMHYPLWVGSGNGRTAAETIPPGLDATLFT